jgi:hypothetical protein
MTSLYREPGLSVSARSVGETFTCDVCGKPGIKDSPNQRRHDGECRRKKNRQRSPNSGIRARQRRRIA